jgi:hypothetical protein
VPPTRGVRASQVREAVGTLLGSSSHHEQARAIAAEFARWDSAARFTALVDEVTGAGGAGDAGDAGDAGGAGDAGDASNAQSARGEGLA